MILSMILCGCPCKGDQCRVPDLPRHINAEVSAEVSAEVTRTRTVTRENAVARKGVRAPLARVAAAVRSRPKVVRRVATSIHQWRTERRNYD